MREYAQYRKIKPEELLETLDRIHESAKGMKTLAKWQAYIEEYTKRLNEQARKQQDKKRRSDYIYTPCGKRSGI